MNLKLQAENINHFLTEIYAEPTRLSELLIKNGISPDQVLIIREKYLSDLFSWFVKVTSEIVSYKAAGNQMRAEVVIRRFGLQGSDPETLQKIGDSINLSRERIRQLEKKALSKARRFYNKKLLEEKLRDFVLELLDKS